MSNPPPYNAVRPPPPYQPGSQPVPPMAQQPVAGAPPGMYVLQQPGVQQPFPAAAQPQGIGLAPPVMQQPPVQPMFFMPPQVEQPNGAQQNGAQQQPQPQQQQQQQPMYVVMQPPGLNSSMSGSTSNTMYLPSAAPPPSPAWGAMPHQSLGASGTLPIMMPPGMGGSLTARPLVMMADPSASPNASLSRSPGQSTSSRPQPDVKIWGFALADAYHPSLQRVPVPPSVVRPTRGITNYNNDVASSSTMPCSSTVCLKYSGSNATGGCPLGDNCPNFHVDLTYMEKARHTSDSLCCGIHNDYFTQEMLASNCAPHMTNARFTLVLEDRAEIELVPSQLSFTIGLEHLSTRASTRVINLRKQACRLHLEGKCKWTKDCGHVHLCREFHAFLGKFHYPSLIFLLMTETALANIEAKLREGTALLEFFNSKSSIPLVQQLIDAQKDTALTALVNCGARFTQKHWDIIKTRDIPTPETIDDRVLPAVTVPIARHIDAPAKPAAAEDGRPQTNADEALTMPTFSPGASLTNHPS